jgi:hypothetical protein
MANNGDATELDAAELGQYQDGDDDENDPDPAEHKCGCNESARYRKALGRIAHIAAPGTRVHRIARRALR